MNRARELAVRAGLAIAEHDGIAARRPGISARTIDLDQDRLNISVRYRYSRLPWRGQFAPELVQYLMDAVCHDSQSFFDPFCGSGTVLFEAVSKGKYAHGSEANPAAWHLASLAMFSGESTDERRSILRALKSLAAVSDSTLFGSRLTPSYVLNAISTSVGNRFLSRVLAAGVLLGMRDGKEYTHTAMSQGALATLQALSEYTDSEAPAVCHLEDARDVSADPESMDAIITSPPYINVFNYHQNYRSATELLGWRPLEAARSEIGANRKHRINRFLTVIQYCLDMSLCLDEMARILRPGAPLILILGRISNVLGVSFKNGRLLSQLLSLSNSFGSVQCAQRVFTNRFGDRIFEDILITHKERQGRTSLDDAREIATIALLAARTTVDLRR